MYRCRLHGQAILPLTMVALFVPSWTRLPFADRVPAFIENLVYTRSSIITLLFIACGMFLASRIPARLGIQT